MDTHPVVLVTDDFVLYHRLTRFLEPRGIRLHGLPPGEPLPATARVVLDGPPNDPRAVPVRDDLEATWLAIQARLDRRPVVQDGPHHVIIGVDPGLRIGLAVVVDGAVYWTREARSPDEAAARIRAWRTGLSPRHWSVHVGDGSPTEGREVCRLVAQQFPEADLHIVPEQASTPGRVITESRHTDAAILIARRSPQAS